MVIRRITQDYTKTNLLAWYQRNLYKAEKPSVCLSIRLSICTFWHADNSAMSARIATGLARNESCVFEDHKVYFYKPIVPAVHPQECLEDEGVSSH